MTTDVKTQVFTLRKAGKTYTEIAEALVVPIGSVRAWCHREGLKVQSPLERLTAENKKLKAKVANLENQLTAVSPVAGSLKDARDKGLKKYFTGKPCSRGHIAPRLVCNRACVVCAEERGRRKGLC